MEKIKNRSLIKDCSYINGQWLASNDQFKVINPATQEQISTVYEVESTQLELAIISASHALTPWQSLSITERNNRLNQWQLLLRKNLDDLARLLVLEQGKPFEEAKGEILHAANYVKIYSELATGLMEPYTVAADTDQEAVVYRRPIGVVTAITPWNFPCSMVLRKAAAALASGCCVVLKPSELTPLTALALAQLSIDAKIPAGVFNVVVGSNAQAIGEVLTQHPKVAKFSFTGSTNIGKKLLAQCASGVKRTSMELGGNAPFIVFEDADLDTAVEGAIASKFRNAGQTCVTPNRFIVHENIETDFKRRLVRKVTELKLSNGLDKDCQVGPLITQSAIDKMSTLIKQALEQGAQLVSGGNAILGPGFYFQPTVLDGVTASMDIFNKEIFGPVISIISFKAEKQAIQLANQTELGLCGYIYTSDQVRIDSIAAKIQVGMLGINEGKLSNPLAPFGGIKQSGMGREGGHYGIEEYLDYQYVCKKIEVNS